MARQLGTVNEDLDESVLHLIYIGSKVRRHDSIVFHDCEVKCYEAVDGALANVRVHVTEAFSETVDEVGIAQERHILLTRALLAILKARLGKVQHHW